MGRAPSPQQGSDAARYSGAAPTLTLAGLTRTAGSTVNFTGLSAGGVLNITSVAGIPLVTALGYFGLEGNETATWRTDLLALREAVLLLTSFHLYQRAEGLALGAQRPPVPSRSGRLSSGKAPLQSRGPPVYVFRSFRFLLEFQAGVVSVMHRAHARNLMLL